MPCIVLSKQLTGFVIGLLLCWPSRVLALNPQTLISQYAADHWRTADGLPQASVLAIA